MCDVLEGLPLAERIPLRLRGIFEQYGYQKYQMSKFEPYDLYWENRNFIQSEGILTFTSADGRLMALRPDVTTSIIKHASAEPGAQKLYYLENVFRTDLQTKDYKEIRQMGLEYIGGEAAYAQAEVVFLALQSLRALGTDYRLNLNHMGLMEGALAFAGVCGVSEGVRSAIKQKNPHELAFVARTAGVAEEHIRFLIAFSALSGELGVVLAQLEGFVRNDQMAEALGELTALARAVEVFAHAPQLRFDASVINDMDYYNGTVFRGYIPEAPGAVLSGGRYDNMMRRFGREQCALGFALYLGELDRAFYAPRDVDADVYLWQNGFGAEAVAAAVRDLTAQGLRVYVGEQQDSPVRVRRVFVMSDCGAKEVLERA